MLESSHNSSAAGPLQRMKVLIVVPSLKRSGAETQSVDLANGLAEMGHHVHLCSFERTLDQRSRLVRDVTFHHVLRTMKYDYSVVTRLAEIIDLEEIDVVQGVLQFACLIASLAARRSRRSPPVVAAVHTTINRGMKQELQNRLVYRYMLRRLPAIVFVCEYQCRHWIKKFPEVAQLAKVVHNGIDPCRFDRAEFSELSSGIRDELGVPRAAFVFTCLAAFRPEKGHDLLVRAFASTPADTYLLLAGDGERRVATERQVRKANLGERVRFLGNVPDVRPLVVASDATVLASTAVETFSMAMLESMALGVPMIAPDIGGLAEAIIPGKTGLLFPIGDERKLAQGMQSLVADRAAGKRMGAAAQVKVANEFTLQRMLEKSENVLHDVIAEKGQQKQ